MKYKILVALLAVLLSVSIAAAQEASVEVSDQTIEDSIVTVDRVEMNQSGWVVIHMTTEEDGAGPVIGWSAVDPGVTEDHPIVINTTEMQEGENHLVAMLHTDDDNGEFDFPEADEPITIDGESVQDEFNATLPAQQEGTPVEEETPAQEESPTPTQATPGMIGALALTVIGAAAYLVLRE